jgi:acetylornithine deacetylase
MSEVEALLAQLVAIPSINPDLVATGTGEGPIAAFIAAWCQQHGIEAYVQPIADGSDRANVVAIVRGNGQGGRSLMLNAHIDTVGVSDMTAPFDPIIREGKLYGRGAYDMKGALAACMIALKQARTADLRGDLLLSAVADEECASFGTLALLREWTRWPADAVVVTEPTELQLCTAHKGFAWYEIETFGKAAHGSRPHLGIDAITHMGRVLVALDELNRDLARMAHPLLGSGSLHASLIHGGEALSVYPARCVLGVERRTIPGETAETALSEIQAILDRCAAADAQFRAQVKQTLARPHFGIAHDAPLVQTLGDVLTAHGGDAAPVGISFWMDAALFSEAGIPTVVYGPLGAGAHAAEEWVDLASVEQCVQVYGALARAWCG